MNILSVQIVRCSSICSSDWKTFVNSSGAVMDLYVVQNNGICPLGGTNQYINTSINHINN